MVVEGDDVLYLADREKEVQLLELADGEIVTVNGEDILAFESCVKYDSLTMDSLAGTFAGGFTNVHLEGPRLVALTTYGESLVFERLRHNSFCRVSPFCNGLAEGKLDDPSDCPLQPEKH